MNKYIILLLFLFCAPYQAQAYIATLDGLPRPDYIEYFDIEQEDGSVYGISRKETFFIDVNGDGKKDKIIRERFETMTAHGYYFYDIELHNGKKLEIPSFRTVEGADCFLQIYKFQFSPFAIIKASRPLGEESWIQPTAVKIETYELKGDKLVKISEINTAPICDVRDLLES